MGYTHDTFFSELLCKLVFMLGKRWENCKCSVMWVAESSARVVNNVLVLQKIYVQGRRNAKWTEEIYKRYGKRPSAFSHALRLWNAWTNKEIAQKFKFLPWSAYTDNEPHFNAQPIKYNLIYGWSQKLDKGLRSSCRLVITSWRTVAEYECVD